MLEEVAVEGAEGLSAGMHVKQIKGVKAITGQLGTHGIMEDVRDQHKCLRPRVQNSQ